MKSVEIRRQISAPPNRVWSVITDADALQNSDSGIAQIDGEIGAGGTLSLRSEVDPSRTFKLRVTHFEPPKLMEWTGGMPLGLFTGRRRFNLSETPEGTSIHIREDFTGLLAGLISANMPDLNPSFRKLADAVQQLAEA